MDEARLGQQGTLTTAWAERGSRPTAVKQTDYEWVYLFAAVEPTSGENVALLAPRVDTGIMNVFLSMLSEELGPRITPEHPGCPAACRLIDLFCPIGYGTRGLIVSPPKAGKMILLQNIAAA